MITIVLLIPILSATQAQDKVWDRSELPLFPENPPEHWPTYHLLHPGPISNLWANPNPAFYYKGRYHLHYL